MDRPLVVVTIVGLLAASLVSGAAWEKRAEPPWVPHTGSIAVPRADGTVLLLGGQAGEHGGGLFDCFNCTNEVWSYDPAADTWANLSADVPWDPRWGHSAVATTDDTVWMLFGCCERGKPTVMLRDIWTYNPAMGVPWTRVPAEPPFEGVQATSVAVLGEDLWIAGGWSQQRGTLSMVVVFSTRKKQWSVKSDHGEAPWLHRADHATAISPDGQWLFLYSGQHRDARTGQWSRLKDTWRVELPAAKASTWEQLGDLTGARSSVPVALLPSGWLLALGGHYVPEDQILAASMNDTEAIVEHHRKSEFSVYNDVLALDIASGGEGGWRIVEPDAPWHARDDCAAAVTKGGSLAIFGGGTLYGGGGYLRDVWVLEDPAAAYGLEWARQRASSGGEL